MPETFKIKPHSSLTHIKKGNLFTRQGKSYKILEVEKNGEAANLIVEEFDPRIDLLKKSK